MDDVYIFDGHNDAIISMIDYKPAGRDFLVRSENGHLDLARALEGRLAGGLFAVSPTLSANRKMTSPSPAMDTRFVTPML